jgi:hypothetical protein
VGHRRERERLLLPPGARGREEHYGQAGAHGRGQDRVPLALRDARPRAPHCEGPAQLLAVGDAVGLAHHLGHFVRFLDRFDLSIDVPAVTAADLILPAPSEGSADVAERVAAARVLQAERYRAMGLPGVATNAAAPPNVIEDAAALDAAGLALLRDAAERMRLSARGYHRVLKLARTLADLDAGMRMAFTPTTTDKGLRAERVTLL